MNRKNIFKSKLSKNLFSDALLIALFTGVAYIGGFLFQSSYLYYYGVSTIFVDINLRIVLLTASCGLLTVAALSLHIGRMLLEKNKNKFFRTVNIIIFLVFMAAIITTPFLMLATAFNQELIELLVSLAFLVILGVFIYAYFINRKARLLKHDDKIFDIITKKYGITVTISIVVIIYYLFYCLASGIFSARIKDEYLISNTSPEIVVISSFYDNLIGVKCDSKNSIFYNEVVILSPDKISSDNITFVNKKTGPLNRR